jgi:hypothetical protein
MSGCHRQDAFGAFAKRFSSIVVSLLLATPATSCRDVASSSSIPSRQNSDAGTPKPASRAQLPAGRTTYVAVGGKTHGLTTVDSGSEKYYVPTYVLDRSDQRTFYLKVLEIDPTYAPACQKLLQGRTAILPTEVFLSGPKITTPVKATLKTISGSPAIQVSPDAAVPDAAMLIWHHNVDHASVEYRATVEAIVSLTGSVWSNIQSIRPTDRDDIKALFVLGPDLDTSLAAALSADGRTSVNIVRKRGTPTNPEDLHTVQDALKTRLANDRGQFQTILDKVQGSIGILISGESPLLLKVSKNKLDQLDEYFEKLSEKSDNEQNYNHHNNSFKATHNGDVGYEILKIKGDNSFEKTKIDEERSAVVRIAKLKQASGMKFKGAIEQYGLLNAQQVFQTQLNAVDAWTASVGTWIEVDWSWESQIDLNAPPPVANAPQPWLANSFNFRRDEPYPCRIGDGKFASFVVRVDLLVLEKGAVAKPVVVTYSASSAGAIGNGAALDPVLLPPEARQVRVLPSSSASWQYGPGPYTHDVDKFLSGQTDATFR